MPSGNAITSPPSDRNAAPPTGPIANPLVSVIIPAHNAQETIGRALDSLLAQTLTE